MAKVVRQALELDVAAAKQELREGRPAAAQADLAAFVSRMQGAVKANEATQYTGNRLIAEALSVSTAIKSGEPELGLRLTPTSARAPHPAATHS